MFKIINSAPKTPDWKVVSLMGADGEEIQNVSVNRTNKKGETFPNFDDIKEGGTVDGRLWLSPAGKQYLFAPNAPRVAKTDSSPAGNNGATAELKNILRLQIQPTLDQINKRVEMIMNEMGLETDPAGYNTKKADDSVDNMPF